jgi:hypothetical protein
MARDILEHGQALVKVRISLHSINHANKTRGSHVSALNQQQKSHLTAPAQDRSQTNLGDDKVKQAGLPVRALHISKLQQSVQFETSSGATLRALLAHTRCPQPWRLF